MAVQNDIHELRMMIIRLTYMFVIYTGIMFGLVVALIMMYR